MGLYIDMEMPKEGSWVTLRVFPDGQCVLHSWCGNDDEIKFDFMEHLTAIPVPEPHGRLIDADELIEFIENRYEITWKDDYEGGVKDACVDILEKISTMPTAIQASEDEL